MRKYVVILLISSVPFSVAYAGFLDNLMDSINIAGEKGLDQNTVISGLKEALDVGTDKAVKNVSGLDGYMGNQSIRILMPEKMQTVADVLGKTGHQELVDEFIKSMNRAAEKAAPLAAPHFASAIREMSFEDAETILDGGDTAATDYFKAKTFDNLYVEFKPIIGTSMNEVGVTSAYKDMMGKYTSLPFMSSVAPDIDHHVTQKALDGLFFMVAEEEKKIRRDPSARVTDLLKTVFGRE